eukprot:4359615-Pyramimonas_sp.AAC.1
MSELSEWAPPIETDTTNSLSTTGGHVWDAARRLHSYLSVMSTEDGLDRQGVKVLELGAGCGWLGINVARNLPGGHFVLTEQVVRSMYPSTTSAPWASGFCCQH